MNITQRMYFGQFPLDKDRDRRIVFYGRVSTQHEAQVDALGNQMQWYDDQLRYHPNCRSLTAISTRASPEPPPKSARPL